MTSFALQIKAFSERLAMNRQLLQNPYWFLPVDDAGHEDYVPVGRGKKTSDLCGLQVSFTVCKNVAGHNGVTVKGMDCTGKGVVWHNHLWCHNPRCCVCFIRGHSVRGAKAIAGRLEEGVRRGFGKIEHCVVSVAVADRGLPEPVMRERSRLAAIDRGMPDAEMTFHGYGIARYGQKLEFRPHYHLLGWVSSIEDGFDRCRKCSHTREDCAECSGFKGREVRGYAKDGYLVKVEPERTTVFGTSFYLLNHSTLHLGIKRFHTVTYFGKCANRKYAAGKSESKAVCPACGEEGVKCYYVGKAHIVKDIGSKDYRALFVDDLFEESGEEKYVEIVGGGHIE